MALAKGAFSNFTESFIRFSAFPLDRDRPRNPMDADAMQGWVLAHGWSGKNPERLAQYVRDINGGKRPRARQVLRADYVDHLRQRVASDDDSELEE